MVLLAALAAPGVSRLTNVGVLSREYEGLIGRLRSLQARIDVEDVKMNQQAPDGAIRSVM